MYIHCHTINCLENQAMHFSSYYLCQCTTLNSVTLALLTYFHNRMICIVYCSLYQYIVLVIVLTYCHSYSIKILSKSNFHYNVLVTKTVTINLLLECISHSQTTSNLSHQYYSYTLIIKL